MLYREITDDPNRLKGHEGKPGAIELWHILTWVSAVLLLLAFCLQFSKNCEILNKVTRRRFNSHESNLTQFFSSSEFSFSRMITVEMLLQ